MKHKNTVLLILLGWAIALVLPPQAIMSRMKKSS